MKEYEKATQTAMLILQRDPENGSALIILGRICERLLKYDEAIKHIEKATQYEKHALDAYYRLGKIHEKIDNKKRAIGLYKNCLNIQ